MQAMAPISDLGTVVDLTPVEHGRHREKCLIPFSLEMYDSSNTILFLPYPLSLSLSVTTEFCLLDLSVIYIAKGRVRRDSIHIRYLSYIGIRLPDPGSGSVVVPR